MVDPRLLVYTAGGTEAGWPEDEKGLLGHMETSHPELAAR
jgi:hypothetical protein